jgi:hypothetical protein
LRHRRKKLPKQQDERWAKMDQDREARVEQIKADVAATLAAQKKECDRKGNVTIGMTKDQVRASCWGKPQYAVTVFGSSEQWVYGLRYIYFRDGKVEAIQD